MAGTKISEATLRSALQGTENLPIVDTDLAAGRTTINNIKAYVQPDLSNLYDLANYYNGYNSVATVTNIPIDKRLVIATISEDATIILSGTMTDGRELHIIINNSSSDSITVTLPDSNTLDIDGNSFGEVSIIYTDGTQYIRSI